MKSNEELWREVRRVQAKVGKEMAEEERTRNNWHTGTPTEDGYYLCHIQFYSEDYESDEEGYDIPYWFKNGSWESNGWKVRIIAWQKIEPYKEKEDAESSFCS